MWRISLTVIVLLWAMPAKAQCVGGLCRINPLKAPVADKARAVVKTLPKPIWTITRPGWKAVVHTAKATVKRTVLSHNYRTTAHERRCAMCLGQHLRNFHGKSYGELDEIGYKNWVRYHEGLHDSGVYEGSVGCVGGACSVGKRGNRILRRFGR